MPWLGNELRLRFLKLVWYLLMPLMLYLSLLSTKTFMNPQYPGQENSNQPQGTQPQISPQFGAPSQQPVSTQQQPTFGSPLQPQYQNPASSSAWPTAPPSSPPTSKKQFLVLLVVISGIVVVSLGALGFVLTRGVPNAQSPMSNTQEASTQDKSKTAPSSALLSELAATKTLSEAKAVVGRFTRQHGISFSVDRKDGSTRPEISGNSLTDKDLDMLKQGGKVLIEELSKYPDSWINTSKLKKILVIDELKVVGTRAAGLAGVGEDTFYLDATMLSSANTAQGNFEDFARQSVHHELFHLVDWTLKTYNSPEWLALNAPGFVYEEVSAGNMPVESYDPKGSPGFVSGYARFNAVEDKAETFTFLVAPGKYEELKKLLPSDPVLSKKVKFIKDLALKHAPEMNDAFYDKSASRKATPNKTLKNNIDYNQLREVIDSSKTRSHIIEH